MKNIAIQDFMDKHEACTPGRLWVKEQGFTTCKETFDALCDGKAGGDSFDWAIWFVSRPGVLDKRELVGFAAWCARRVAHLLNDERSVNALELSERYAAGEDISNDELKAAADAADDAYWAISVLTAACWASHAAYWAVGAAYWASRTAAAASWAAYAAGAATDPDAERRAQLEHLRGLVKFEDGE